MTNKQTPIADPADLLAMCRRFWELETIESDLANQWDEANSKLPEHLKNPSTVPLLTIKGSDTGFCKPDELDKYFVLRLTKVLTVDQRTAILEDWQAKRQEFKAASEARQRERGQYLRDIEQEQEFAAQERDNLLDSIATTPATSVDGLAAKLKIMWEMEVGKGPEKYDEFGFWERLLFGILTESEALSERASS